MNNRADRRASAKIARQAVKRAKSPTEREILRAAAAFASDDVLDGSGLGIANAGFDGAWVRLADDLHDILEDRYPAFAGEVYAQAGLGVLRGAGPGGIEAEIGTRLFLCPVSGAAEKVAAFTQDGDEIRRLETSLREFGVVCEHGQCLVLPFLLPLAAFRPAATPPGRVRALHDYLSERLIDALSGASPQSLDGFRNALPEFGDLFPEAAGPDIAFGALIGIEMLPDPAAAEAAISEDELDAEDLARTAAIASWYDSYAADLAGLVIGAPLDWPACAAALAWETIRVPMEGELRRRGAPEGLAEIIHCGFSDDDGRLVVSAVGGGVAVGPFAALSDLVWFDADEFFARAQASAETFVEHDNERAVVAPLLGIV